MRRTVLTSDLSGQDIGPKAAWAVISIEDSDTVYRLDLTLEEARELASKGRKMGKRGRPPKKVEAAEAVA